MATTNPVDLLAPPAQLNDISSWSSPHIQSQTAFHSLLQTPFLSDIKIKKDGVDSTLYPFINDAFGKFSSLQIYEVNLVRKLLAYAQSVGVTLQQISLKDYLAAFRPFTQTYIDEAKRDWPARKAFFDSFNKSLTTNTDVVSQLKVKLEKLSKDIEAQEQKLADSKVDETLMKNLDSLLTIKDDDDLARILGVVKSVLLKKFAELYNDQTNLKKIIAGLKSLSTTVTAVYTKMTTLNTSLTNVLKGYTDIIGVWSVIGDNLGKIPDNATIDPESVNLLSTEWNQVVSDLNNFISVVNGSTNANISSMSFTRHPLLAVPLPPTTAAEKQFHELIEKTHGPEFLANKVRNAATGGLTEDQVKKFLGPPSQLSDAKLKEMAANTGSIIQGFRNILQQPYLADLVVTNPDNANEKIDLQTMISKYLKKYQQIQVDSVPVARALYTYALDQIHILPIVGEANGIDLQTFVSVNQQIVDKYKQQAEDIWKKTKEFKDAWNRAIDSVHQAINELNVTIDGWLKTIADLEKQYRDAIIMSVFAAVGAAVFAVAAYMTGGIVMALVGAGLLAMTIASAVKAGKLAEAINGYKASVANARATVDKFNTILPLMEGIASDLNAITDAWNTIVTNLYTISTQYDIWGGPAGMALIKATRNIVITAWKNIQASIEAYIKVVS